MSLFHLLRPLYKLSSLSPFLLLILAPLPLLYFLLLTHFQLSSLRATEERMESLYRSFLLAKAQKAKESCCLQQLKEASPHFIDTQLESLLFLQREREARSLCGTVDKEIPLQQLRFVEGEIRRAKELQEVEERQESPVLMNEDDVKKVLSLIEGVLIPPFAPPEKAPQLIIEALDLRKVPLSSSENVFSVSLKLIKREGLR